MWSRYRFSLIDRINSSSPFLNSTRPKNAVTPATFRIMQYSSYKLDASCMSRLLLPFPFLSLSLIHSLFFSDSLSQCRFYTSDGYSICLITRDPVCTFITLLWDCAIRLRIIDPKYSAFCNLYRISLKSARLHTHIRAHIYALYMLGNAWLLDNVHDILSLFPFFLFLFLFSLFLFPIFLSFNIAQMAN